MSIRGEQIRELLRGGEGSKAVELLNKSLESYEKAIAFNQGRSEHRGDPCHNLFVYRFLTVWEFLGLSDDDARRAAWDAWEGGALDVVSRHFAALDRDWSVAFLPVGEIHFADASKFELIPWGDEMIEWYCAEDYPEHLDAIRAVEQSLEDRS